MSTDLRIKALELAIQFGPNDEVVARADAYLAFLLGGAVDVAIPPTKAAPVKKTEAKETGPQQTKEPVATATEATGSTQTQNSAPADVADEAPTIDYADVKRLILGISSKIGRDAATKLLGEFGVERGPDLKPADYAAFVAKAEPLLAGV